MNKVILLGRLTKDPEVRYSQGAEPPEPNAAAHSGRFAKQTSGAVARYTLAVDKPMRKNGEKEADFLNCVAFGKLGEFAEKYLKKGQQIAIEGRLQSRSYEKDGKKHWITEVVVAGHYFCGTKAEKAGTGAPAAAGGQAVQGEGFYPIDPDIEDDDLPF